MAFASYISCRSSVDRHIGLLVHLLSSFELDLGEIIALIMASMCIVTSSYGGALKKKKATIIEVQLDIFK